MPSQPDSARIPTASIVFGFGPMLPIAAAAIGAWTLPSPWPQMAVQLAIIWAAIILAFVAGVRRGYGFGAPGASTPRAIIAMLLYFVPAGLALVCARFDAPVAALALLTFGYLLVIVFDRHAARSGDAPAHFARLRGPQMLIAVLGLVALVGHLLRS
ncbi:DUF3429 domain-containing protein [Sphingomonas sp. IC-56]|uniref:DUF3429 domain-containing protein n=1 Tax=Sphingomonas sp. IC-56 TaxID=2898529 RepID=UPI001E3FC4AE|nr:DUF3429 domain-containing protein [Sphingomonas sp. IC-56]MCD2323012.1 DUF3429 domain-containing protein [Sphingomonas sp. IC-56]